MDLFSQLSRYVCFNEMKISLSAPSICRRELPHMQWERRWSTCRSEQEPIRSWERENMDKPKWCTLLSSSLTDRWGNQRESLPQSWTKYRDLLALSKIEWNVSMSWRLASEQLISYWFVSLSPLRWPWVSPRCQAQIRRLCFPLQYRRCHMKKKP